MTALRPLILASLLVSLGCAVPVSAQAPRYAQPRSPGYAEGYERGLDAGYDDRRRNRPRSYIDELTYRAADAGYRREYGPREWYRDEFRRGYGVGYQQGYAGQPRYDDRIGPAGPPPWSNGRGLGRGRGGAPPPWWNSRSDRYRPGLQVDLAYEYGYLDGYEAGLDDGADGRRFNPIGERRYRTADRGYERRYGPRELYRNRYRDSFRQGYQAGYDDGRRYGNGRPWWWPW